MLNSADGWLDPSTVKLFMDIKNDSAADITPRVARAWGMFSRFRVLCSSAIIEDIDLYGRLHEQFHMMMLSEKNVKMMLLKYLAPIQLLMTSTQMRNA